MPSKELSLLLVCGCLSHSPGQSGRPHHYPCLTSELKLSERQGDFPQSLECIQNSDSLPSPAILIFIPWTPCLSRACTLPFLPLRSCDVSLSPPSPILPLSLSATHTPPPPTTTHSHTYSLTPAQRRWHSVQFPFCSPCGADLPSWPEQLPLQDGSWCF